MREVGQEIAGCKYNKDDLIKDFLYEIRSNLFVDCPNKNALVFDEKNISYQCVGNNVAKIIAAFKQEGLGPGSVVAICLRKGPEYVYSILACALTGVIWLPIDVDTPQIRQSYLLSNSHVDRTLSDGVRLLESPLNIYNILEEGSDPEIGEDCFKYTLDGSPAYYLYTSGSTGMPKCVVLNNQATANVLLQTIERWNISAIDSFMAITPFHHDMSVFDIFAAMSVGATLVIPTYEQQKNALDWAKLVAENAITVWVSVPAIVDMLFMVGKTEQLTSLRLIAQGGDYIKPSLIARLKRLLPDVDLFSLGGPTETTIWSIWHEIGDCDQDVIPYGKPLENNQYYILNEQHQACAVGEIGKMYMSGINLSNGYLLDGKIIQKDFIQIQTSVNEVEKAFQMSDLGYFREDRVIIFSGREEGYLKVKGVRIAAAEVENALSQHPLVHDAVVVCCTHLEADVTELVAIYTQDAKEQVKQLSIAELRRYLQRYLPSSHIPSRYLLIEALPLTVNGKVDRKVLLNMAQKQLYSRPVTCFLKLSKGVNEAEGGYIQRLVFEAFEHVIVGDEMQEATVSTQLSLLNLRPKQLMIVVKYLAKHGGAEVDFYALARCRTMGDVISLMQQTLSAA